VEEIERTMHPSDVPWNVHDLVFFYRTFLSLDIENIYTLIDNDQQRREETNSRAKRKAIFAPILLYSCFSKDENY